MSYGFQRGGLSEASTCQARKRFLLRPFVEYCPCSESELALEVWEFQRHPLLQLLHLLRLPLGLPTALGRHLLSLRALERPCTLQDIRQPRRVDHASLCHT